MKKILLFISIIYLSACSNLHIDRAINEYLQLAEQIQLGDSKESVLAVLQPTQDTVVRNERKASEKFIKDGVLTEIYFMRSAHFYDGLVTDDEFTPYVFHDGVLIGIGWQVLGGPKTQGQTQPSNTYIRSYDGFIY